jgi:hypothetical protein
MLFASVVKASSDSAWPEVQDLHYGEVLFDYYQQDYYTAIVRLLAAQKKQSLRAHKEDAELLFGDLLMSYGFHEMAEDVFKRMTDSMLSQDIRNRAWFSLAEMQYQEGLIDSAKNALGNIAGEMPKQIVDSYQMLSINLMLAGQQYQEARNQIEHMRDDANRAYGSYNLAISKINSGYKIEADNLLDELGQMSVSDDEMKALRDRSNLSLGFYYLRNNDSKKGLKALKRIRLNGPYSDEALLGLGWALTEQNQLENALATWQLLKERDLNRPAVQEAWIASSFILEKMKDYVPALQANQEAIAAFDTELEQLDSAINAVNEGQLIKALLQQLPRDVDRELWQMELMPNTAIGAYIPHLMTNLNIRKAVTSLQNLQELKDRLVQWENKLPELDKVLAETAARQNRLGQLKIRAPKEIELYGGQIDEMQARIETLQQDLRKTLIKQQRYVQRLVVTELLKQQKRISDYQDQARLAIARIHGQSFYRLSQQQ